MELTHSRDLLALLGLEPQATSREVRGAYRKRVAVFDPGSPVLYGLYTEHEAQVIVDELRRSYQAWLDVRQLSPLDSLSDEPIDDDLFELIDDASEVDGTDISSGATCYDGPGLARIRQAKGLSLENIAQRTKIAMFTLRSIEGDRFSDLPSSVYLKGFLKQLAALLDLNPHEVAREYMERMSTENKT